MLCHELENFFRKKNKYVGIVTSNTKKIIINKTKIICINKNIYLKLIINVIEK
jgi:hypothetical protein